MKTIKMDEVPKDGILINLETEFNPYDNLLLNPSKYLDKNKKYYFYCKKGIKSKKVVSLLEVFGYNVTRVLKKDI